MTPWRWAIAALAALTLAHMLGRCTQTRICSHLFSGEQRSVCVGGKV